MRERTGGNGRPVLSLSACHAKRGMSLGLVALACGLAAGCGDDEPAPKPTASPDTATEQTPAPSTSDEAVTDLPAPGADKLTAEQRTQLLAKNNEVALGDDGPSVTGPVVAANYRDYAKPLSNGRCKQALTDSANTWEQLAKADSDGDVARKKTLGQVVLKNSDGVFSAC